jgi:hypothetical protein
MDIVLSREESRRMLMLGLALAPIMLGMSLGMIWILHGMQQEYAEVLSTPPPIFIQGMGGHYLYGALIGLPGVAVMPILLIVIGLRGRRFSERVTKRIGVVIGSLAIAGLILGSATQLLGNAYRGHQLQQIGLSSCPNSRIITGQFFQTVWVRDPSVCQEVEFRKTLQLGSRESLHRFLLERESRMQSSLSAP